MSSATVYHHSQLWAVFSKPFRQWPLLCISAPVSLGLGLLRLPLFFFPLWILGQNLPGDVAGWLPEGVVSPTPLSSTDLCGHWFLICCLHRSSAYLRWPLDTEDLVQTAVDKSLELTECWLSHSPCFRSIEEYWLHVCVRNPQFGGFSNLSGAPKFLEDQKGSLCSSLDLKVIWKLSSVYKLAGHSQTSTLHEWDDLGIP